MQLLAILIISIFSVALCDNVAISPFTKDVICDVVDRISEGCSREAETSRSRLSILECVAICVPYTLCIGASVDVTGKCFLHRRCPRLPDCTVEDLNHRYVTRYCVYGEWNPSTRSCDCTDFAFGPRCNRFMKNCADLITPGHVFGEYKVMIDPDEDGLNPVNVVCRTRSPDHWSIMMLRNEGKINFNRTWEEYRMGFYVDFYNLWAGLDAWHLLSEAGCRDITTLVTFEGPPTTRVIRTQRDFVLGDESSGYAFTFSSSSTSSKGTPPTGAYFGDCLNSLQNTQFSTFDRDNDGDGSVNCASHAGSAWWYSGCDNPCNLLGYGFDHWFTKPRQELFSVEGVDMDAHASFVSFLTIYMKCA